MATSRSKHARSKKPAPKAARSSSSRGAQEQRPGILASHAVDLVAVGLGTAALLVALAVWFGALGPVGKGVDELLGDAVGIVRWIVPLLLAAAVAILLANREAAQSERLAIGGGLGLVALTGLAGLTGSNPSLSAPLAELRKAGGYLGALVGHSLSMALGSLGAAIVLLAVTLVAGVVATGIPLRDASRWVASTAKRAGPAIATWWGGGSLRRSDADVEDAEPEEEARPRRRRPPVEEQAPEQPAEPQVFDAEAQEPEPELEPAELPPPPKRKAAKRVAPVAVGSWTLPSMDLLDRSTEQRQDQRAVEAAGAELVAALESHGVVTTLVGFTVGPTVTRYELELGAGVKVARVTGLAKDIAYAMASPDVRILAPIPGRQAIGVEVPNRQRQLVTLGDLLASDEAAQASHPLSVALGRDIAGRTVMQNLAEFPHVLISGATGAGKSSAINGLITSLLMRTTPEQVRMILVDPKRVELGQYNDLPHLLSPVVVDPKKAANALSWAVKEMERRYDILAEQGVRDITSYHEALEAGTLKEVGPPNLEEQTNLVVERARAEARGEVFDVEAYELEHPKAEHDPLPFIVVVVDELNDLMMVAARDVEESVVRIAQMARAVGIHLVLATQRPSVDVITGVIKANVPSRMAFSVSSLADSRVILDQPGAERLVGKGDMLLLTASSNVARRIQAPWVSEEEVRSVVSAWRAQGGSTEQVVALSEGLEEAGGVSLAGDDDDELLAQARDLVVRNQLGSTSMLQRKLKVGFARAGRLMDLLEEQGVVGPSIGSKARAVLMTPEELGLPPS